MAAAFVGSEVAMRNIQVFIREEHIGARNRKMV
jgi:hypothetical protein